MKRITSNDLKAMYAPVTEQHAARMNELLAGLPAGKETIPAQRKMSTALVLAVVLLCLSVGAMAAVAGWNAIRYLYDEGKPELESMLTMVNQEGQTDGVTIQINTAVTDGYALVLDWTLHTQEEALPLYLRMEELRINGERYAATVDGLFSRWLTEGETLYQGGEMLALKQPVQNGDVLHLDMRIGVYRPKEKVVVFDTNRRHDEAVALAQQGAWVVEPVAEINSMRLDENGKPIRIRHWANPVQTQEERLRFDYSEISLAFDVQVRGIEELTQPLYGQQTAFEHDGHIISITQAVRTAMGVYVTVDVMTKEPCSAEDADAIGRMRAYHITLDGPWDSYLYGMHEAAGSSVTADEDGRLHHSMRYALVAYQEPVLEELEAVQLQVYTVRGTKWIRQWETFLFLHQEDAADGVSFMKELKPVQERYETPLFSAVFESIRKTAKGDLFFDLVLDPAQGVDAKTLADTLKVSIMADNDWSFKQNIVVQAEDDQTGEPCVKVVGTMYMGHRWPETETLNVQCTVGEESFSLPFYLYQTR